MTGKDRRDDEWSEESGPSKRKASGEVLLPKVAAGRLLHHGR